MNLSFSDITTTITPITSNPYQPCSANPCLNGAFCFAVPSGGFRCVCQTGYTGLLCEDTGSLEREVEFSYFFVSFLFLKTF